MHSLLHNAFSRRKRPFLLLEVLIAFALVIFCAIPLIAPHVDMFRAQRSWLDKEELDHAVNLLYVDLLEKLYTNKIDWITLRGEPEVIITPEMLKEAGYTKPLYFTGKYKFTLDRFKPKKEDQFNLYLYDLTFSFVPIALAKADTETQKKQSIDFNYKVFVARDLR